MTRRAALEELAALHGVRTSYHEVGGRLRTASEAALAAVLTALGAEVDSEQALREVIAARRRQLSDRVLPPIVVCWDGTGPISLRLPLDADPGELRLELELEGGTRSSLDAAPALVTRRMDEHGGERLQVELRPRDPVPVGYHRVTVRATSGAVDASARLWSSPRSAYQCEEAPGWGLFAPLYALSSDVDSGIGDFESFARLCRWVSGRGGSTVATLPLLPTFVDSPYDPSPYAAVSRRCYDERYLALCWLEELAEHGEVVGLDSARELRDSPAFRQTSAALRAESRVDYRAVQTHKRRVLALAADAWFGDPARLARAEAAHPMLADYARFRAVGEQLRRPLSQWPERLLKGQLESSDFDAASYRYHLFCQVEAQRQLERVAAEAREAGVGLYLDLPLGAHPEGYDAFRGNAELAEGCSVGAPPDSLFEGGQDWGFAPPHPERCSELGHPGFVASLRHHMRHAATLRIDHVMGLHRLFFVPRGLPPTEGVYVDQPAEELYAALCIESVRSRTRLVGEDLGTVPPEVRQAMVEHGLGRLYVLHYEQVPQLAERPPVPPEATASINTHDMPTFFGFWGGSDIDALRELGFFDDDRCASERDERRELRRQLERWLGSLGYLEAPCSDDALLSAELRYLADSPARTVLVSLGDLMADTVPQNIPGTGPEQPNWTHRAPLSLSGLERSAEVVERLSMLRRPSIPSPNEGPPLSVRSRPFSRLSERDLHLFNEGTHRRLAQALGAHPTQLDGVDGVYFAVWAPNARAVSVIGDFNGWDRASAPLWLRDHSGIWEGFVPGAREGDLYKFHVTGHDGSAVDKADPMALMAEPPPRTASVVTVPRYEWGDAEWMSDRARRNSLDAPCSIYEVHLGSFMRADDGALPSYRQLAGALADHVASLGFTHVELLPVMEHPFYGSWGYQVTGYFGATSRYGRPEDLMFLVDTLHQRGIGVIFDWVPGHFPTDEHGLGRFDGTHLYEHADPRKGFHPDWKSYIFNYGRHEVRSFLVSSALYWLRELHGDGLRVDGVASMLYLDYSRPAGQWVPNRHGGRENLEAIDFLRQLNVAVYEELPDVQVAAEESTAWPMVSRPTYLGGLGFGLKWDLGWMHDTLSYFSKDPIFRRYHHEQLTFRSVYAYHENFVLPLSHDEVVHGKGSLLAKMPGDEWQRFANLRLLFAYMYACPGHKLLFMGSELAAIGEWDHERPLPLGLGRSPLHAGVARTVSELNRLYRSEPALYELDREGAGFEWIDTHNAEQSVLVFERRGREGGAIIAAFNFTPVPRTGYRIGVGHPGHYRELLNTDATELGGSGMGNFGGVEACSVPAHGRAQSIEVTLPPLGALYFRAPE